MFGERWAPSKQSFGHTRTTTTSFIQGDKMVRKRQQDCSQGRKFTHQQASKTMPVGFGQRAFCSRRPCEGSLASTGSGRWRGELSGRCERLCDKMGPRCAEAGEAQAVRNARESCYSLALFSVTKPNWKWCSGTSSEDVSTSRANIR